MKHICLWKCFIRLCGGAIYYGKILKHNLMMGMVWLTVPPNHSVIPKDEVDRIDFIEKFCYNIGMTIN